MRSDRISLRTAVFAAVSAWTRRRRRIKILMSAGATTALAFGTLVAVPGVALAAT